MKKLMRSGLYLLLTVLLLVPTGFAAEVSADEVYCFSGEEFGAEGEMPDGVFITAVPDAAVCVLCMGTRVIRAGDVLAESELSCLTLAPRCDETISAEILYQPIQDGRLGGQSVCRMQIRSTGNEAPTAEDGTLETYKNVANTGTLRACDPEGDALEFAIAEQPRLGKVELTEGGAFVYTPKKNKVGSDSFTFVATDLAGNTSEPARIEITIKQPLDAETFSDMAPEQQFLPIWLRECGLYGGERVADRLCFAPARSVTRGEFLVMAMKLAGIDPEIGLPENVFADQQDAPEWMQPYLSAGLRRGIALGCAGENELVFRPNEPVTAAEAAAMLTRCFGLRGAASVGSFPTDESVPAWAETSVAALQEAGVTLPCAADETLTVLDAAKMLYQAGDRR